ncbi:MAG: hypothetical protein KCHDKBKB_00637 [Elusimicrobia bacterium]|nr:hypothetical protein [Elusimicrobiota bacterium]
MPALMHQYYDDDWEDRPSAQWLEDEEDIKTIEPIKIKRRNMSGELQIYDPTQMQSTDRDEKQSVLDQIAENSRFFKVVGGMSDRDIDKIKVKDLVKKRQELASDMTIGKMRDYVQGGIKAEPVVYKVGRWLKKSVSHKPFYRWEAEDFLKLTLTIIMSVAVASAIFAAINGL